MYVDHGEMELTNDSEDNVTEKSVEDNFKQFRAYLEQNVQTVDLIAFFTLFERGKSLIILKDCLSICTES